MSNADPGRSALEINLQRTAAKVEIPESQRVLLDVTAKSAGIRQRTQALLEEVNHPYANWGEVLQDLRTYAMENLYYIDAHERGVEGLQVLIDIFFRIEKESDNQLDHFEAIRSLSRFLEKLVRESGELLERNRPLIDATLREIDYRIPRNDYGSLLSGSLRRLFETMHEAGGWNEDTMRNLLADALRLTYDAWLRRTDPSEWIDPPADENTPSLRRVSHEAIWEYRKALDQKTPPSLRELIEDKERFPDQSTIEGLYLYAAEEIGRRQDGWSGYTAKVLFLLRVLDTKRLKPIHDTALRAINRAVSRALLLDERPQAAPFLDRIFDSFQVGWMQHDKTVLDCIHAIAQDVLRSGDEDLIRKLIDRMIEHGFESPDIRGVDELWRYKVNPAHVPNIRSWIELISLDPPRMKRLLAALIVHMRMGGVFVSDTDLLQKEMALLLNADVRPVYNLVKQLGKLMPIYFNEIGAEGRIREVSTRLDELCARKDELAHFLRKQCHVESSTRLVPFLEATFQYWASGDRGPLRSFLPDEVFARLSTDTDHFRDMHKVFSVVGREKGVFPDVVINSTAETATGLIDEVTDASEVALQKAKLSVELYYLMDQKYRLTGRGALDAMEQSALISRTSRVMLRQALEGKEVLRALEHLIPILEELRDIILDPEPAKSSEDIYKKRHLAAGIPSMYGRFVNRKVEALGLTYRLEALGTALFDELLEKENLRYMTRRGIKRILHWILLFERSLRADGIHARELAGRRDMLESGLGLGHLSIDQFINIFQFTSRTLREIIRDQFTSVYEIDADRIAVHYVPTDEKGTSAGRDRAYKFFETFLREQISTCFGLQQLDNLIARILQTLQYEARTLSRPVRNLLMSYDIDKCFAPIFGQDVPHNDPIFFGHKGFGLRKMADYGFPVPAGFILTTEIYRCYDVLREFEELTEHSLDVLRLHIRDVEYRTGKRFGDPENPLLLSVRSGSAISMPGILDTFLNAGINEEIAEAQSKQPRFAWAAWDNYRRFLQCWGISYGIQQDVFDKLFEGYKSRYSITKKRFFTVEQIREIALACKKAILEEGVRIIEDPFEQLRYSIDRVLDSWNGDRAKVYRREMNISNDWGTAVVVQAMVYGNLDERSGTGVIFTRNPRKTTDGVSLYGDFVLRSQGEDVVRGLVETFPISEEQRHLDGGTVQKSLEASFPEIYGSLLHMATELVEQRGYNHQEMEFTFEDEHADSLYVLQTREIITAESSEVTAFARTEELEQSYLSSGIGVGGGALCGIAAHSEDEIRSYREKHPDRKIILIRPNTVPDDMSMIFLADGLLTSRGGCTSHAAVAAQRIGRTCVVGCRSLIVDEHAKQSRIGENVIRSGDMLGISGYDGSVYYGEHEIKLTRKLSGL